MAINPINSTSATPHQSSMLISPAESESKSIQNEITSKNQRLKRLSSDAQMTPEEKEKERQEIQKQLDELNRKLRHLRTEQKEEDKKARKEQEYNNSITEKQTDTVSSKKKDELSSEKLSKEDDKKEEPENEKAELTNIPPQDIQKLLEAGSLLQRNRIQESIDKKEASAQNILEAEIESDKIYGTDVSAKKEKLSTIIRKNTPEIKIEEKPNSKQVSPNKIPGKVIIREDSFF